MTLSDRIRLIPRQRREDERGWLLKVLDGREMDLPCRTGEIYLTLALQGQVRGNHYHRIATEWFTVVTGEAEVVLTIPATEESLELRLSADKPETLFVPPGVAHAFRNPLHSKNPMLLVAYASELYDPSDTFPYTLISAVDR